MTKENKEENKQILDLIKKIDQDPKKVDNYLSLSTKLIEQGSFDQAKELLEKARGLVKHPQDLDYNLAVCYYLQGDFEQALALLEKIPNDDLSMYQKALVYLKLGQNQKALAYALSIKKIDNQVKELIGDVWLSLGELSSAKEAFLSIAEGKRSAKVNFLIGVALLESDKGQADRYFELAKEKDPSYYAKALDQYTSLMKLISNKENKE